LLKALVIIPNSRTREISDILQIAKSSARKAAHLEKNPPILALEYISRLNIFIAVYEVVDAHVVDVQKPRSRERAR